MADTEDDPIDVLKAGYATFFITGTYTDFTITCGPHSFNVHKVIICAQSDYFNVACSKFSEGNCNSIKLKAVGEDGEEGDDEACDDPEVIKIMVRFFYTFDYSAEPVELAERPVVTPSGYKMKKIRARASPSSDDLDDTPPTDGNTVMHAKMFATAVKYQVPALRKLARTKFVSAAQANWNHQDFAAAARIVYTSTAENVHDLRDVVSTTIDAHPELLNKPEIDAVVRDIGGLAYELLRMARGKTTVQGQQQKSSCLGNSYDCVLPCDEFCPACDRCFNGCCGNGFCPTCRL